LKIKLAVQEIFQFLIWPIPKKILRIFWRHQRISETLENTRIFKISEIKKNIKISEEFLGIAGIPMLVLKYITAKNRSVTR
jgi:uncharacterized membrane protein